MTVLTLNYLYYMVLYGIISYNIISYYIIFVCVSFLVFALGRVRCSHFSSASPSELGPVSMSAASLNGKNCKALSNR